MHFGLAKELFQKNKMGTNDKGISLIKSFEGLRLNPYKCAAGIWTIGYGATYNLDGSKITEQTQAINIEEAEVLLKALLRPRELQVLRLIKAPLTSNQFAACVSFVYNLGSGSLQCSTLRTKINRKDYVGAAEEFNKWVFAGGRKLGGLVRRRYAERQLFLSKLQANAK